MFEWDRSVSAKKQKNTPNNAKEKFCRKYIKHGIHLGIVR